MENSESTTIFPKSGRGRGRGCVAYEMWSFTRGSKNNAWTGEILVFWRSRLMGGGRTWRLDCMHFRKSHSQPESEHPAKIITVVVYN